MRWMSVFCVFVFLGSIACPGPALQPEPPASEGGSERGSTRADAGPQEARSAPEPSEPQSADAEPISEPTPKLPNTLPREKQAQIDAFVHGEMSRQGLVGVAVGVVFQGEVAFLEGYGWQDKEAKIPVVADRTMFRWASISKTLAGVLALQLQAQKKLDLDRDIREIFKTYKLPGHYVMPCTGGSKEVGGKSYTCTDGFFTIPLDAKAALTSRMLLGHLGGIAHYSNGKGNPTPPSSEANDPKINTGIDWALKYLLNKPLIAPPGERYSYTTFGFNLMGVVLEHATQKSFGALVKAGILGPAKMNTMQPDYEWKTIPHRAVGYYKLGTTPQRQGSSDVSWKLPGGGYISTVQDLTRYCRSLTDDTLLTDALKAQAWTAQKPRTGKSSYGLGFGVGSRNGRKNVSHTGSQQKTRTHLRLYPQEKLCITVMTNSTWASTSPLVSGIEDILRR